MSALKTITFYAMMAAFIAAVCWLSEYRRETESPFNTAEVVWDPLWTTDLAKSHAPSLRHGQSPGNTPTPRLNRSNRPIPARGLAIDACRRFCFRSLNARNRSRSQSRGV